MILTGGFRVDPDHRVRGTFGHTPSTLRLSMFDPNLQQIPRGTNKEKTVEKWVKECFVAPAGSLFYEIDFAGIEAVLVGYFAGSPEYIRCASLGVHDYLVSHLVECPVDLGGSDRALSDAFKALKKAYPEIREKAKRVVHGSNYMMTPRRMHELYPETFPTVKDAALVQGRYFEIFPAIRKWHFELARSVDGTKRRRAEPNETIDDAWTLGVCYAKNPFGYVHHFYNVLDWSCKVEADGTKHWVSSFGDDAKRLAAFLPSSTAAAIIKKAAKSIWYRESEIVSRSLRLLIHDSIMGEAPEQDIELCVDTCRRVMEAPIEELPLDPAWGLGTYLTIRTEAKIGRSWGDMR